MMKDLRQFRWVLIVAVGMLAVALTCGAWAQDSDSDGVEDAIDVCLDTVIPEEVPMRYLGFLRFALTDDDTTFNKRWGESSFTLDDTGGCSCEQIIELSGLGVIQSKFGCSLNVMRAFIGAVYGADGIECPVFPGDGAGNGPELSYTDNGDGTVTDNNTGLIWEVKDDNNGIHNVDNTYTWSSTGSAADGTLFTEFLDTLNNTCDGDEITFCTTDADCAGIGNGLCGHAGYRDWEIPHVKLLQSIVDYGEPEPAIDPTFPGPTAETGYWSFTSGAFFPSGAWDVDFGGGGVFLKSKGSVRRVRAVRGGG